MPFTKETAAAARKKLADTRQAIREADCRASCGRKASVTAGAGRGMCSACNARRLHAAKRDAAQQQQERAPRGGKGRVESKRRPAAQPAPAATTEPPAGDDAPPAPEATPRKRSRLGAVLGAAMNTSISGRRVTD